ncbi:MAG: hypothetical protein AAFP08_16265, partial [Bacteroidota bacterium]
MLRQLIICVALLFQFSLLFAQDENCSVDPLSITVNLSGNYLKAPVLPGPINFLRLNEQVDHLLINVGADNKPFVFAQNLWLGGISTGGSVKASITVNSNTLIGEDSFAGPLNNDGSYFAENCDDFNRVWEVRRHHVLSRLSDYENNSQIDNPIPEILGWPASGNDHFVEIFGFELPSEGELAPFKDLDNDGKYEPINGEYPVEPASETVPEHMTWEVYNTRYTPTTNSFQGPLIAEVHLTHWSHYSSNIDQLNKTIFSRYQIINRDESVFYSFRAGIWTNFELGCIRDDYIGCSPERNTYFSYNEDNFDDFQCEFGAIGFGNNPPVASVTFLNKEMDAFVAHMESNGPVPSELSIPNNTQQVYDNLRGRLLDGFPIT